MGVLDLCTVNTDVPHLDLYYKPLGFSSLLCNVYSPVTYISMPSLKVKMVVVLELLAPAFTSLMLS